MFRAASAGTKSRVLVMFGYAQMALNTDATFEFHPQECHKGLLPAILLCFKVRSIKVGGRHTAFSNRIFRFPEFLKI